MKFICGFCGTFAFDEEKGDAYAEIPAEIHIKQIPSTWRCPVCGHWKGALQEIAEEEYVRKRQTYEKQYPPPKQKPTKDITYYRNVARKMLKGTCAVNKVCDGNPDRLCQGQKYGKPIGFGGAGQGRTWNENFQALQRIKLKMRVIREHHEPEFATEFLGAKISMPIMASSISGTRISMNDALSENEFQRGLIQGAKKAETIALSGNTVDFPDHPGIEIIGENQGWGIPVFKPQSQQRLLELFGRAEKADVTAIGVDLEGYGSTNWEYRGKPLYRKSPGELRELVDSTEKPVIFKGIMSNEDASEVLDSGAKAVDISNHGGRVMDCGQGVAEVLPQIVEEFKGKIKIMADGAVRTGFDALKLLALGADVVLIGRPLAWMSLAGGAEAVAAYLNYVRRELRAAMLMTCCDTLNEIDKRILVFDDSEPKAP